MCVSSRVAILRLLNSFAQDSMQQVLVIEVESNASEIFLHQTASKLQFGRQSQRPLITKEICRLDGSKQSILGFYINCLLYSLNLAFFIIIPISDRSMPSSAVETCFIHE